MTGARRRSAGLSLAAAGLLGVQAAYQLGVLRRLPDPPGGRALRIDSSYVCASGEAYWVLGAADAPLGVTSFALTAALAGREELTALWRLKTTFDAGYALYLAALQPLRYQRLCVWCLSVTALALAARRASGRA